MSKQTPVTILVVDDDSIALHAATSILRQDGYKILTARDGMEAIMVLGDNPDITVLFTDVKMPRIDGIMLADMAKVHRPKLKVLYATGFSEEVGTRPGIRHGIVLEKPYDAQQLREEVKNLLLALPCPDSSNLRRATASIDTSVSSRQSGVHG